MVLLSLEQRCRRKIVTTFRYVKSEKRNTYKPCEQNIRVCVFRCSNRLTNIGVENLPIVWKVKHGNALPRKAMDSHLKHRPSARTGKYIYDLDLMEDLTFLLLFLV